MKTMRTIIALGLSVFLLGVGTSSAQAASQNECAIWLCLPGGFPTGCGGAHSAMIDRIKDLKPPLPPFASCMVSLSGGGGSTMSSAFGVAAYIPPRRECTRYTWVGNREVCAIYRNVPERRVMGTSCREHHESGIREPAGCTRTERYAKVFIDGEQEGETYWWR